MNVPEFRNDVNFRGSVEANDINTQNETTFQCLYEDEEFCSFLRKLQCIASANGDTNVIDSLCKIADQYEACFATDWVYANNLKKEILNLLKTNDIYLHNYLKYNHQIADKDEQFHNIWAHTNVEKQPVESWISNFLLDMKYCKEVHKRFEALITDGNYEGYMQEFNKWIDQTREDGLGFIPIGQWPEIVKLIPEDYRRKEKDGN
jgi:hypothetical protein